MFVIRGKRRLFAQWAAFALLTGIVRAVPPDLEPPADRRADELISLLHLEPLAGESGYFGGVHVSDLEVASAGNPLKAHSSIYYLLTRDKPINYLHRLESDDTHVLLEGGPVDYYIFHPDGTAERQTLGRDLAGGQRLMISIPGGCWKALRLRPEAGHALMANVLSPQWTPGGVVIGGGADFVARFTRAAPWADETFLRELIGPNWR